MTLSETVDAARIDQRESAPASRHESSRLRTLLASDWATFVAAKMLSIVVSFVFLVVVTFLIVQLIPGDPARVVAGEDASIEAVENTREELGLNDPFPVQFANYVIDIFTGGMGESFRMGNVADLIALRMPYTFVVAVVSILVTILLAVPLGTLVAIATQGGRRRALGTAFSVVTALIDAMPVYVRATLMIILFALTLRWLPAGGVEGWQSYILPVAALSIGPVCAVSRVVRREAESVLEADFVRTLHGWRLPSAKIYLRYVTPSLLTSTLTLSGLMLSGMIGGALVMETVFSWPGLGSSVVDAILLKDFPVVQGTILVLGMMAVLINVFVDLLLALIDPQVLTGGKGE